MKHVRPAGHNAAEPNLTNRHSLTWRGRGRGGYKYGEPLAVVHSNNDF